MEKVKEFVVDTREHCFLCLNQIQTLSPKSSYYSLQYLSRHLRMDMRKVFNVSELIPPHLIRKVERSKLKVQLCETCALVNEQFSVSYKQLENMQMEVESRVDQIQQMLLVADKSGGDQFRMSNKEQFFEPPGNLEVIEILRNETLQKCRKICSKQHRVKIQNRNIDQIRKAVRALKRNSIINASAQMENRKSLSYKSTTSQQGHDHGYQKTDLDYVKMEGSDQDFTHYDEIGDSSSDVGDADPNNFEPQNEGDTEETKMEVVHNSALKFTIVVPSEKLKPPKNLCKLIIL